MDLCATQLKLALDYDAPALRAAAVTLRPTGPLDGKALWALTNRSLLQRGLTTVAIAEMPGLSVVKVEEASKVARIEEPVELKPVDSGSELPPSKGDGAWTPRAGFRNAVYKLKFISAKEAAEIVRSVLNRGSTAAADSKQPGGGSGVGPLGNDPSLLLISDASVRLDEAEAILRRIDVVERATLSTEVPVQNLTPTQVAASVAQLVSKRDSVGGDKLIGEIVAAPSNNSVIVIAPQRSLPSWKALIAQADRRDAVETLAYTPKVFAVRDVAALAQQIVAGGGTNPDDRFKVVVEEPTGTLLVTATSAQHGKIRDLMERLDSVPGEARRPMRSFSVRNRSVTELMDVLQKMISAGALTADSDRPAGAGGGTGAGQPGSGLSPVALPSPSGTSASPSANILLPATGGSMAGGPLGQNGISSGGPTGANRGNAATPLPITLTADPSTNTIIAIGDARLIAQLDGLLRTLDVRQPQVMLEVVLVTLSERDSLSLGVELQQLIRDGNTAVALSSLFGLSTVTGSGATTALRPSAASGFTGAVIRPGDFSAVVKALQSLGGGRAVSLPKVLVSNNQKSDFDSLVQEPYGVSFTQGNSTATNVTFGGTLDAGTKLSIKPQISEGDSLLLEYTISISSFGEQGRAGNLPPSRQVTTIQSMATVPDGHTVVVGGLESTNESNTTEQLPLVGSIPLIGELFKNQTRSKSRSRFFVLVKASVMRGQSLEALRNISAPMLDQSGIPDGWPSSEVQIIK